MGRVDLVSASAGSGKTHNMAYRYIMLLIDNPTLYRNILAVTFTNKATDELKSRILQRINLLAQGNADDYMQRLEEDLQLPPQTIRARAEEARNLILHDYNSFSILTIDKFFQRIIRAFIKEMGIDLNFNLELQTDSLLSQAADKMLDELAGLPELRKWVMDFISERIEEGKPWDIKGNLVALGGELFKEEYRRVAVADSQAATLKQSLKQIVSDAYARARVAVDRYSQAGKKFVAVMDRYGLTQNDFYRGSQGVGSYMQRVAIGALVKANSYVVAAVEKGTWCTKNAPNRTLIEGTLAPELRGYVEEAMEHYSQAVVADNTARLLGRYWRDFALLADLRERIDAICYTEGILPISDVNTLISKLIANNDAPFIYEKSGNRYSHFMIDEFQDTSTIQWRNFVPLLHNALAESEGKPVMLVGDVKQSIYRWRGGDWSLLARGVEEEFEEVERSSLRVNHRSSRVLVEFNNSLIKSVKESMSNTLRTQIAQAVEDRQILSRQLADRLSGTIDEAYNDLRQEPKEGVQEGYVSVMEYNPTEQQQTDQPHPLIKRIEELQQRGYRAKDIAVLVRTHKEAKHFSSLILEYKNSHPSSPYTFDLVTQEALEVNSSPSVRFVISCLKLSTNPADALARAAFNGYFGTPYHQPLSPEDSEFIHRLALMQPEEAFNEIVLHYPQCCTRSDVPYLQALHNQIIEFCSRRIADTALFVAHWDESGHSNSIALPEEANAITIVTIHKSKGLGYKVVIIPACSWQITAKADSTLWAAPNSPLSHIITHFPIRFVEDARRSEFSEKYYTEQTMAAVDALNTLYVAVTRAKQELHIILPKKSASNQIGPLVKRAVEAMGQNPTPQLAANKPTEQQQEQAEGTLNISFGNPEHKESESKPTASSQSIFRTYSPSGKVAVSFSHQRYKTDGTELPLSPREQGTLLHRAFENASCYDEIVANIDKLVTNAEVSPTEAEELKQRLERAFSQSQVRSWFSDEWDKIMTEREIISSGSIHRPDRVMTRGEEKAVVVDYKFGLGKPAKHSKQIEEYAKLLRQMGYKEVEAYLWYISTEQIVQVV